MAKKAVPTQPKSEELKKMYKDKPQDEVILDTLLKISEVVLDNQKTLKDILQRQRAGKF